MDRGNFNNKLLASHYTFDHHQISNQNTIFNRPCIDDYSLAYIVKLGSGKAGSNNGSNINERNNPARGTREMRHLGDYEGFFPSIPPSLRGKTVIGGGSSSAVAQHINHVVYELKPAQEGLMTAPMIKVEQANEGKESLDGKLVDPKKKYYGLYKGVYSKPGGPIRRPIAKKPQRSRFATVPQSGPSISLATEDMRNKDDGIRPTIPILLQRTRKHATTTVPNIDGPSPVNQKVDVLAADNKTLGQQKNNPENGDIVGSDDDAWFDGLFV